MRESSLKEVKMRFFEKVLVLFVAICVSLAGFNMIASSSLCLLKMAKEAGYETMQSYPVVCDADFGQIEFIAQKTSQLQKPNTNFKLSSAKTSLLEERNSNSSGITQDQ
jgi:hypothetical protein